MRQQQDILSKTLINHFGKGEDIGNSIPIDHLIKQGLINEVKRNYIKLGGVQENIPLKFEKWDIILKDFAIELDEEQHFNRYRAVTLESYIYHTEIG